MYVQTFYALKPLIPRWLQLQLRRRVILRKREKFRDRWPIDEGAAGAPESWRGWPEGKRFALVLTHDVEGRVGVDRCRLLADIDMKHGFRSSFNFVAEGYRVDDDLVRYLRGQGFEIGLHGLRHDRSLYRSRRAFEQQAVQINRYLREWGSVGFRSPSMYHNLEWLGSLDILYDASTFDTDPFEPQPDGVRTIFPFLVERRPPRGRYVELPYTLPQDFALFVMLREKSIEIWRRKLDWIVSHGGMALINVHPDYMGFAGAKLGCSEYPSSLYEDFLSYASDKYGDVCWHALPREVATFWNESFPPGNTMGSHSR